MSGAQHESLNQLSQTAAYQRKFRYKETLRTATSADTLTIAELGHMLDTLKDAALLIRHIDVEPWLDVQEDPAYKYIGQKNVPDYVNRIASDFRTGSTFNRTDTGRIQQAKMAPDIAGFMNQLHGLMRQQGLIIGKSWVIPESIRMDVERYDAFIKRYENLLDAYKDPTTGQRNYKLIPAAEIAAFAADFEPLADRLYSSLQSLPEVLVNAGGTIQSLPNAAPLNDRLERTYPALVLFAFRTLGKGAADNNKRPAVYEYETRQREIIGAQSMITDTTHALFILARKHGFDMPGSDLLKSKLVALFKEYTRSFALLLTACRAARCGYQVMYDDLRNFIHMGEGQELSSLENDGEASLLLYALERRLVREARAPQLAESLRQSAATLQPEALRSPELRTLMVSPEDRYTIDLLQAYFWSKN